MKITFVAYLTNGRNKYLEMETGELGWIEK